MNGQRIDSERKKKKKIEQKKTHRFDSTWFQHHIDPILSNGFSCISKSTEKPILAVTDPFKNETLERQGKRVGGTEF